jgi:hypothetical protein
MMPDLNLAKAQLLAETDPEKQWNIMHEFLVSLQGEALRKLFTH